MNYSTNVSFDFFSEFSDVSKLLTPTQFIGRMVYLIEPFRGISIKSYKNIRVVKLNQVVESIQSEIFHTYQVSYTKQRSDNLLEKYKCFEDNISNIFVSGLCSVVIGSFQNILNLVPILRDDFSSHIILIADNSNVSMKMKNDLISKYTNLFVVEKKEIRNFLKKYLN
ncbi:hypothetical protein M0811_06976 [Anaeramoeba ignava]|uniref:Uncharacterized protein n=1 Tax=Anaeramoeba ignava TaxID=1746090 RepID=A0A9Q0LPE7_ANAIG|nr:hypothetical protein M0811_06976 [Anaeramoeba ignava]